MNPLPPSPSALRPKRALKRRKYTDFQIAEAVKLAKEVSVAYAVEQTGVARSWIYKTLRPTKQMLSTERAWRAKVRQPSALDAMLASPLYPKAVALAELWYANVGTRAISMRSCLQRAAESIGLDGKILVRAYKKQKFTCK